MIGMDHFQTKDELFVAIQKGELHRNFQGYTQRWSYINWNWIDKYCEGDRYYAQIIKDDWLHEKSIDNGRLPFERGVELSYDDLIRKYVIMELMANFKVDMKK